MRKIKLYIATSIDGYIASKDGSIDWLNDPTWELPGEDFGYTDFMQSIDTTLMGNKTYQQVIGFDVPWPYSDYRNIVFTRKETALDSKVEFHTGDIPQYVKALKTESGKDIWLIGGSEINGILLDAGLIDEIRLTMIPIVLGNGIPLFSNASSQQKFKQVESKSYPNGMVQLRYELPK